MKRIQIVQNNCTVIVQRVQEEYTVSLYNGNGGRKLLGVRSDYHGAMIFAHYKSNQLKPDSDDKVNEGTSGNEHGQLSCPSSNNDAISDTDIVPDVPGKKGRIHKFVEGIRRRIS
jgi:hypothetical protein